MLAHSRYASDTLVTVLEDDAQDGGDHMDAHRLEHLNLNTAYQRPMTDVFDIAKGKN